MREETKEYNPKIIPYEKELEVPKEFFWSKFVSMDLIIDLRGVPHLLEINGIPNALGIYDKVYGSEAVEHLVDLFPRGEEIGFLFSGYRKRELNNFRTDQLISDYSREQGTMPILIPHNCLGIDSSGLYTDYSIDGKTAKNIRVKRFHFNFLFNRCLVKAELYKLIPKERRKELNRDSDDPTLIEVINPLLLQALAINKEQTYDALSDYIAVPKTYYVESPSQLEEAIEGIDEHIQEEHPEYQKPWIVIKPPKATGGKGVDFIMDKEDRVPLGCLENEPLSYPFLVQERISSALFYGHECDLRAFFAGGGLSLSPWLSKCIVRTALGKEGYTRFATSLSMGGDYFRMDEGANETISPYIRAVGVGIERQLEKKVNP